MFEQRAHARVDGRPRGRRERRLRTALLSGELVSSVVHDRVQIRGGEVRAQIHAVPPDGAVVHETVFQEDLLTGEDVGTVKRAMPVALTTRSGIGGPPRYVRGASEISTVNPNTTSRIVVSRHQGESHGADVGRQPCARSSSRATRAGLPSVRAGLVPAEESARHEVRQHALRLVRIHAKKAGRL